MVRVNLMATVLCWDDFDINFQVNTFVGLFWIMLKISTWLVVFFAPPQILLTHNLHHLS